MHLPVERSVNKNVWTLKNQFHMDLDSISGVLMQACVQALMHTHA